MPRQLQTGWQGGWTKPADLRAAARTPSSHACGWGSPLGGPPGSSPKAAGRRTKATKADVAMATTVSLSGCFGCKQWEQCRWLKRIKGVSQHARENCRSRKGHQSGQIRMFRKPATSTLFGALQLGCFGSSYFQVSSTGFQFKLVGNWVFGLLGWMPTLWLRKDHSVGNPPGQYTTKGELFPQWTRGAVC